MINHSIKLFYNLLLGHVLDKAKMLNIIYNSDLINDLCINTANDSHQWQLNFCSTPPADWVKVTTDLTLYSKENILKHVTLLAVMDEKAKSRPTDSETRWVEMTPMFSLMGSDLFHYEKYVRQHMQAMFQAALDENVQYLEARFSSYGLYVLNETYDARTFGHQYLDTDGEGDTWFVMVREELAKFKAAHPEFIGYRDIINGKRYKNHAAARADLDLAIRQRKKYPDIVSGFDMVAEEDQGYSLLHFIDDLATDTHDNMPFFFHTAETSWPDDLLTSMHPDDPVSTLENTYDAILMKSRRVGHGLGYIKHPYLMQILREHGIAVEANPVSNMLLGYVQDQRHHPAITYIRSGIPVVMGADDPGSMGYNEFTVDWYEAFMAWGLDLKDLKQLSINSLNYSTMEDVEKQMAFLKWRTAWDSFIADVKQEACAANMSMSKPEAFRIFPREGPVGNKTNVSVFGRNFESAICQNILCRFGDHIGTSGEYVHSTLIRCPVVGDRPATVDFSISLDSGQTFINVTGPVSSFRFGENTGNKYDHREQPVIIG